MSIWGNPVMMASSGGGGGGESVDPKQVNFIDYDGTVLYSYTLQEANALSALPANPSHSGLTAQGWNWTLAQIKAQLTAVPDGPVWVGQMYVTQSGDTEIDVRMPDGRLSPVLAIAVDGTVTVDWGDNTSYDTVTGTSTSSNATVQHTYASPGSYTMKISVVSGSFAFYAASDCAILRKKNTSGKENEVYANCVRAVRLGSGITKIGNYAFNYCRSLSSITIPSSVTSIVDRVFYNCHSLASITIPSNVTSIGGYAFMACYSLVSITIPSGVTSIGNYAFSNSSLASITIPSSVTSIGPRAFDSCVSLTSVVIPSGVTSIGNYAFSSCNRLASITIPGSVTSIGNAAFYYCYSLASLTIQSGVTSTGNSAFSDCYSLASVTIPSSVTSIVEKAFYFCSSLVSVTIPSAVTSIGNTAFSNCYGVAEYHIKPTTPPTLGTTVFSGIASDCVIYVPAASLDTYKAASGWSSYASYMRGE